MSADKPTAKASAMPYVVALLAVLAALMFGYPPERTVDPNAPIATWPVRVELPECGP